MTARELAAQRQLLAAQATLQRVRLAHDVAALRNACRPPQQWRGVAGLVLAASALAAVWWARSRAAHTAAPAHTAGTVWALRGLTLWRAARALQRVWRASRPGP